MLNSELSSSVSLASLPNATLSRRVTAGVYDLFLLFAVGFFYTMIITLIATELNVQPTGLILEDAGESMKLTASEDYQPMLRGPLYQIGLYASLSGFYLGFWKTRSATLGMQTWRLKLIDDRGNKPTLAQLILRVVTGTLSLFCFGLGFLYSLIDQQNRTLHDIASGTRVVVTPKLNK